MLPWVRSRSSCLDHAAAALGEPAVTSHTPDLTNPAPRARPARPEQAPRWSGCTRRRTRTRPLAPRLARPSWWTAARLRTCASPGSCPGTLATRCTPRAPRRVLGGRVAVPTPVAAPAPWAALRPSALVCCLLPKTNPNTPCHPGPSHSCTHQVPVTAANLRAYLDAVVEATLGAGVAAQVRGQPWLGSAAPARARASGLARAPPQNPHSF